MTPEELRERALAEFAAQAKEAVIVKVLERIADGIYETRNEVRQLRRALMIRRGSGPDTTGDM